MSTWLENYLAYTETQESPRQFHLWCGISLIAATLSRKTWLPCISRDGAERYRCFPGQMAVILVAGSGKAKKSTAIADIAEEILKESGTATIFDGKVTPERLLAKLGSQPSGNAIITLIQHELTTFLSKQSYQEHMIDILTKLIDCKDDAYETQTKTYLLKNVCVTMLFGTTPRNLGEGVPPQAHDTGYTGRHIFVFGDRSGKIDPLTAVDIDVAVATKALQARNDLIIGLRDFSRFTGPFTYAPKAREWFDRWYTHYSLSEASDGEGYPQRKPDHLRRVSMVLAVSRGQRQPLSISIPDFELGLDLLEQTERDLPKCFAFVGRKASAELQGHIVDVFRNRNGTSVTAQELYARTLKYAGDPRTLKTTVEAMVYAGFLSVNKINGIETWSLLKEPS